MACLLYATTPNGLPNQKGNPFLKDGYRYQRRRVVNQSHSTCSARVPRRVLTHAHRQ